MHIVAYGAFMARTTHNRYSLIAAVVGALAVAGVLAWLLIPRLPALAERTAQVGQGISDAYHVSAVATRLLDDKPDNVLLLFQNSWELRPTGGFITALGEATVTHGRLSDLSVVASDANDDKQTLKPPLPAPMHGWISTPYLTLRDANWDPDFPTAAATVQELFTDQTGRTPDLVIAITTQATEDLVRATGPLTFEINGHSITVNDNNVTSTLEQLTDVDFATLGLTKAERKQVLVAFSKVLLPAVQQHVSSDPAGSLGLLMSLVQHYDVQLWSKDPALDAHLEALPARRTITPAASDALLVVDTNLNSYKTDPFMVKTIMYNARLGDTPTARLQLTYRNTSSRAERLTTAYHDYVRIYVPAGSELISTTGLENVTTQARHGRTVFAGMFTVDQGVQKTVALTYKLGPSVGTSLDRYALILERQAGSRAVPVIATVSSIDARRTLSSTTAADATLQ